MGAAELSALSVLFYEAALDPALWGLVMRRVSDALGGTAGVFIVHRQGCAGEPRVRTTYSAVHGDGTAEFAAAGLSARFTRFPPEVLARYMERYFLSEDLWYRKVRQHCRPGSSFIGSQLIGDGELRRSAFFRDILKPGASGRLVGAVVQVDADSSAGFTVSRPLAAADFGSREQRLMAALLPHLQRACQLDSHWADCRARQRAAEEALHRSATATVLLGADGGVLFANRRAEALFARQDGIRCQGNAIRFTQPGLDGRLAALIAECLATARGQGRGAGGLFRAQRPSGGAPYQVLVSPLNPRSEATAVAGGAAACVLIHDPARPRRLPEARLRDLYGLTPAEARTACLFLEGSGPVPIAGRLGVAVTTVRTHLYRIMEKTGTHSQVELIRVLDDAARVLEGLADSGWESPDP